MLKIGELNNELDARTFGDYLIVQGVENQVDPNSRGGWDVWVVHEQQLAAAEDMLVRFRSNPDDPVYDKAARGADAIRREAEKLEAAAATINLRRRWRIFPTGLPSTVALLLIVISVVITAFTSFSGRDLRQVFAITSMAYTAEGMAYDPSLPEILHGQVWRLITPIYLHFGIMHILFNMMWMRDLGTLIERKEGSLHFALMVLAMAVIPNLGQFFLSGPGFGGMSGVNYGLLGYIWIRGRFDPFSGYILHPSTVVTALTWYFLCLSGSIGHIANTVHTLGLGIGIAWGFVAAKLAHRVP